jgi:hypothetical protein
MPHLANCAHSNSGWCLDCVKILNEDLTRLAKLVTVTMPESQPQNEKAKSDIVGFNYHQICPNAIRRIATIFHAGAKQYGENNYQKGINDPVWLNERFNHAMDHLLKYREGDRSEDHLAKVGWYVCVLMGFEFDKEKINAAKEENAAEKEKCDR